MENEEKQKQRLDKNEEIKETGTLNLNGNGHKANIQLLTIIGAVSYTHLDVYKRQVLGCVFPNQYEEMIKEEVRATVYTLDMAHEISNLARKLGKTCLLYTSRCV